MTQLVPIERIVEGLALRARDLAQTVFPAGYRDGMEWRVGSLAGEKGSSLAVHVQPGPRAGVWADFASGEAGDALDLVAQALCRGDKGQAIQWARAWLGLDGADPDALTRTRQAEARSHAAEAEADEEAAAKRNAAYRLYLEGVDLLGTPAERYLLGRGLAIRRLDFPVGALRYHPRLWDRLTRRHWPGMVAAIVDAEGKFLGCHRTFLGVRPDGSVGKAPIVDEGGKGQAKRTLGATRGGAISLWKGIRIDPETGEVKKAKRLALAGPGQWIDETEGIEDGLTVALANPEFRVLVGVSLSKMPAIRLHKNVVGTRLWQQNDPPGSKAAEAFERLVLARQEAGLRVRIARPPEGTKDANAHLGAGTSDDACA